MSERTTEMSVPLDSDGFLRRECPTCEREFKWFNSPEGEGEAVPDGGYYCPYCAIQAPSDSWLTKAQIRARPERGDARDCWPELDKMARDLQRSSRGGLISFDMKYDKPRALDPLVESDDMRRVDFACHPGEPVKVLDDWRGAIHCLVCGTAPSGGG